MKLLVIGGGGREHSLCWKLAQSPRVTEVIACPGNPGIGLEPKVRCVPARDFSALAEFCRAENVQFAVVGPDQALADGATDTLEAAGIPTFGPTQAAARIESSKAFAKDVMRAAGIPTAAYHTFSDLPAAQDFLRSVEWGTGWVVKADGLALGKGVVVAYSREQALAAAEEMLSGKAVGAAGKTLVIEERLEGIEVSGFYLCDGKFAARLGYACDYKRIFDGNLGPNTGGMGAYSPADWLPPGFAESVEVQVVYPLLRELERRGTPFKGTLFVGLMSTRRGPKVIEFNARFGDPETQALFPLIDEDLLPWLEACRNGKLQQMPSPEVRMKNLASVHVVMAAAGYPASPRKGDAIFFPAELLPSDSRNNGLKLFFAGVTGTGKAFFTNGGRVLGLTAVANTREEARRKAYDGADLIRFADAQRRGDVGQG